MRDTVSAHIEAPAEASFDRISDIARLPEWNGAITEVLEQPERLQPASIWKVRMRALGQTWVSKSMLLELDPGTGIFRYRSQTDDGNPSYAEWEWRVEHVSEGSDVTATFELHPLTFWRKYLLVHLRRPALRREVRASLHALSRALSARSSPPAR